MDRRGGKSFPRAKLQEMLNYSTDKKLMMINQEKLTERNKSVSSKREGNNEMPEFYTQKFLAKTITAGDLKDLWVSLRTEPVGWVQSFIYTCQGDRALSSYLAKVQVEITSRDSWDIDDEVFDKEFSTLKALKCLMNQKLGAERVKGEVSSYVSAVSGSLLSPRLLTRRIAAETLTFAIAYRDPKDESTNRGKFQTVLNALDKIPTRPYFELECDRSDARDKNATAKLRPKRLVRKDPELKTYGRFGLWISLIERTLEGKGANVN